MLLFPEGAIRLQGSGREILERCDGQHTVQEIVEEMQRMFSAGNPDQIREEVGSFLQKLHEKRIVDL
jgi:pyrroloquinoline quinone biosynthesis protein D